MSKMCNHPGCQFKPKTGKKHDEFLKTVLIHKREHHNGELYPGDL